MVDPRCADAGARYAERCLSHPYQARPIAATHVWLTPPAIKLPLGEFDLDPCAAPGWPTAIEMWMPPRDGLAHGWSGRVWLNPPYGRETGKWLAKLAAHGNGIALVFARTETRMFAEHVWPRAQGVLFLRGRPHFHLPDGARAPRVTPAARSCLSPTVGATSTRCARAAFLARS